MKKFNYITTGFYLVLVLLIGFMVIGQQRPQPIITEVFIPTSILNELNDKFPLYPEETVFCLRGIVIGNRLNITSVIQAEALSSSETQTQVTCPSRTIATIHNHPTGICKLSSTDMYTFGRSGHLILGIYCSSGNVIFYNPTSLDISNVETIKEPKTGTVLTIQ